MPAAATPPRKRVLIVDDSPAIRALFKIYFKRLTIEVEVAEDGQAAIEALERATPDLILLDLMMPRMNGAELLEHLDQREVTRAIPRIIISARDDDPDPSLCGPGHTAFVRKPVSLDQLQPLVLEALDTGAFAEFPNERI